MDTETFFWVCSLKIEKYFLFKLFKKREHASDCHEH